ncbi:hypothetical protein BpHYR1_032284 [Brachionus plicatilis]|uniref:Uncharacterized protein n=1 Tax=Brachionus plicatilis TaxID=10195 RepID=A0A3M7QP82_BRAPC|nr:hypothetical protein BpHYR1_032284 [Brachionus plicatilis]
MSSKKSRLGFPVVMSMLGWYGTIPLSQTVFGMPSINAISSKMLLSSSRIMVRPFSLSISFISRSINKWALENMFVRQFINHGLSISFFLIFQKKYNENKTHSNFMLTSTIILKI